MDKPLGYEKFKQWIIPTERVYENINKSEPMSWELFDDFERAVKEMRLFIQLFEAEKILEVLEIEKPV